VASSLRPEHNLTRGGESDFLATAYKKIGINPEKEYISNIGRPFKLADTGKPIDFFLG